MTGFLTNIESSLYIQVAFFIMFLIAYYYYQEKLPTFRLISLALARMVILVLIFSYFFLSWSSAVNPSLRTASVFGMSIINLYLLWQVIITRAELPFRLALQAGAQQPDKAASFQNIIHTGKRFYYLRHFWQALFSGASFRRFLHSLAADRIRQDLKSTLHQQGVDREFITFQTQMTHLKNNLAADDTLPKEFKDLMTRAMADFSQHPWIEEQINQFLLLVLEAPERFYTGDLSSLYQSVSSES